MEYVIQKIDEMESYGQLYQNLIFTKLTELDEKDDKQFRTLDLPELAIEVEPITKPKVDGRRDFMRSISS